MSMRTPLKRVRHLGSAKEGADHFWRQRVTAVALLFLGAAATAVIVSLIGADYQTARRTLANPAVSAIFLLLVGAGVVHMRLGMQVIIEDYIHTEGRKIAYLMLNTFFSYALGVACVMAVLKLSFGA